MAENRPDVATFRTSLYSAMLTWWNAEGSIDIPTKPSATTIARPPLVFPNTNYSAGTDDAFVEIDWLPGTSVLYGPAPSTLKEQPATLQATVYVREGTGEGLLDILADRVAAMFRAIAATTVRFYATDDPAPAPAPPSGFFGQVVRTQALRLSQP